MSMSMHVVGYQIADEQWNKMKAVWDACAAVGVYPPEEVLRFFRHEYPKDAPGQDVDISDCVSLIKQECSQGYEVALEALPESVRFIRFVCSW